MVAVPGNAQLESEVHHRPRMDDSPQRKNTRMNANDLGPIPSQQQINDVSLTAPSISGYPFLGVIAAWNGSNGISIGSDQSDPPFSPQIVNSNWSTFDTPAVALSVEWEQLYLAWVDRDGSIQLANSGDSWESTLTLSGPGSSSEGPALLFANDLLYIAWKNMNGYLILATCDENGNVQNIETGVFVSSRPTLAWSSKCLYILSGGSSFDVTGAFDNAMSIVSLDNQGGSITQVQVPDIRTFGPPSMAVSNDTFHIVWAEAGTMRLRYSVTNRLDQFDVQSYSDGCHMGGPSIFVRPEDVTIGWSYGASPQDPRAHRISFSTEHHGDPSQQTVINSERLSCNASVRIQNPCPQGQVYNPENKTCVPRGSTAGRCVLDSFTGVPGIGYLFNPIKFAICMIKNR